ncbi:MAG: class I poly(R)-hydroxyalkanoic acid synthase, partial [Alphaproteobacteria bacterium]
MGDTQTEKRTGDGQNRTGPASAGGRGGGDEVDQAELARHLAEIAEKSRRLVADFLARQSGESGGGEIGMANPMAIGAAFFEMTARLMSDPSRLVQAQAALWNDYMRLWQSTTTRLLGGDAEPIVEPAPEDRRFRDRAWSNNALFDFVKQSYLLTARSIQGAVKDIEGLDERTARKVDFYTRQFVDALAPSNFVLTNPEVLRATVESRGENLLKGLENLLDDLERGKGRLQISMTDMAAFKIGENVAATPGKVVYQND